MAYINERFFSGFRRIHVYVCTRVYVIICNKIECSRPMKSRGGGVGGKKGGMLRCFPSLEIIVIMIIYYAAHMSM